MVVYDVFRVDVTGINDAPTPVELIVPARNEVLSSRRLRFDWTDAIDVDGDSLLYSLVLSGEGLDTIFAKLQLSKFRLDGSGILQGMTSYTWKILTSDGSVEIESEVSSFSTPDVTAVAEVDAGAGIRIFPNPFSETTTISFHLISDAEVNLTIYNDKGSLIWSETTCYPSGAHQRELDPEGNLRSGTYVYRLRMDNGREVSTFSGRVIKL